MGRKKKPEDEARSARLHVRGRPVWVARLAEIAEAAGDRDTAAMVERLVIAEAKRLKLPPPPPR